MLSAAERGVAQAVTVTETKRNPKGVTGKVISQTVNIVSSVA